MTIWLSLIICVTISLVTSAYMFSVFFTRIMKNKSENLAVLVVGLLGVITSAKVLYEILQSPAIFRL